jgi:hypothetical protein
LLGYGVNQTILNCIFAEDCNLKYFEQYFDPNLGNCFQFNKNKNITQKISGLINGLELELITDPTFKHNQNYMSQYEGFFIYVGDYDFNYLLEDGIRVSTGYSTNVILEKYISKLQDYPYSNCTEYLTAIDSHHSFYYKKTIELRKSYTRKKCIETCAHYITKEKCGCFDPLSNIIRENDTRFCKDAIDFNCLINFNFSMLHDDKYCNCPYECETDGFNKEISVARFPSIYYADYLLSHPEFKSKFPGIDLAEVTFENFKNSIASVNIFFNEIRITEMKESIKFDKTSLVSNIGGLLGKNNFYRDFNYLFLLIYIYLRFIFRSQLFKYRRNF